MAERVAQDVQQPGPAQAAVGRGMQVHPVSAGAGALGQGLGALGEGVGKTIGAVGLGAGDLLRSMAEGVRNLSSPGGVAGWLGRRADAALDEAEAAGIGLQAALGALDREPAWAEAKAKVLAAAGGDPDKVPEVIAGAVPGGPYKELSKVLDKVRADAGYGQGLDRAIKAAEVYDRMRNEGVRAARRAGRQVEGVDARLAPIDRDVARRSDAAPGINRGETFARTIARLISRLFAKLMSFLGVKQAPAASASAATASAGSAPAAPADDEEQAPRLRM
jgi:hypothetical protein